MWTLNLPRTPKTASSPVRHASAKSGSVGIGFPEANTDNVFDAFALFPAASTAVTVRESSECGSTLAVKLKTPSWPIATLSPSEATDQVTGSFAIALPIGFAPERPFLATSTSIEELPYSLAIQGSPTGKFTSELHILGHYPSYSCPDP